MNAEQVIEKVNKYVMNTYSRYPVVLKKGKGCWVWDLNDKKYLDFTTGIAVTSLGHANPEINHLIREQIDNIIHTSNLFYTQQQAELSELLVNKSFARRVFFCNSGTEAIEAAIKLARKWGTENGKRYRIVSTIGSFHGRTFGSLSATGNRNHQLGYAPLLEGFDFVQYGNIESVRELLKERRTCAVIVEPVQGENGVIIPGDDYLSELRNLCDEYDTLLILDEIQVGLGRTGKLFAHEHSAIEPDIMALAKSMASGIPCGAILANEKTADCFNPGSHGTTFGGNPLALSCALKVFQTVMDTNFLKRVTELGTYFLQRLKQIEKSFPHLVVETRGLGLILGIEYRNEEIARNITSIFMDKGLLTILTVKKVSRILPPLIVEKEEIDTAVGIIEKSLKEVR